MRGYGCGAADGGAAIAVLGTRKTTCSHSPTGLPAVAVLQHGVARVAGGSTCVEEGKLKELDRRGQTYSFSSCVSFITQEEGKSWSSTSREDSDEPVGAELTLTLDRHKAFDHYR